MIYKLSKQNSVNYDNKKLKIKTCKNKLNLIHDRKRPREMMDKGT